MKISGKGAEMLGTPIKEKEEQVVFLKKRLEMFLDLLDAIEPESTELEDIDRLLTIIDELENKCREFNHRDA